LKCDLCVDFGLALLLFRDDDLTVNGFDDSASEDSAIALMLSRFRVGDDDRGNWLNSIWLGVDAVLKLDPTESLDILL